MNPKTEKLRIQTNFNMYENGNVCETGDKPSTVFDSSDKVPYQPCTNTFSCSPFSGVHHASNICSHPTSTNRTMSSRNSMHSIHQQPDYFSTNRAMEDHREVIERNNQYQYECYNDSHEHHIQSSSTIESRYIPNNNQMPEYTGHMVQDHTNGASQNQEHYFTGVSKQNPSCDTRLESSMSRNITSELNVGGSFNPVSKSGPSMDMIGCVDMIRDDEIKDMLNGYLSSYDQHVNLNDHSEQTKHARLKTPIKIPRISYNTTCSDAALETRPSSAISSSSVVSPSSTCETVNSDGAPYDANQSPSQLSNDSGFSGDYSRPLSIQVPPPYIPDTSEGNVQYKNCAYNDSSMLPIRCSDTPLLQQVHEQYCEPSSNHSQGINQNIFTNRDQMRQSALSLNNCQDNPFSSSYRRKEALSSNNKCISDRNKIEANVSTSPSNYRANGEINVTKMCGENVYNRARVVHQNNASVLPSFYEQNLQSQLISNREGEQNLNRELFYGSDCSYSFHETNNVIPLPNGEELSHIVDQVLNSIDAQFSPPLYATSRPRKTSNKDRQNTTNYSTLATESVTSFQSGNDAKCDTLQQNNSDNINSNLINYANTVSDQCNGPQKSVVNLSHTKLSQEPIVDNNCLESIDTLSSSSSKTLRKLSTLNQHSQSVEIQNTSDGKTCDRIRFDENSEKKKIEKVPLQGSMIIKPESALTSSSDNIPKTIR